MNAILDNTMKLVRSYAKNMHILLVEDEPVLLAIYKELFDGFFKVCDTAKDGKEALDIWLNKPAFYDLIITDVNMHHMNGLELIRAIRKESLSQSIIVITGNTDLKTNQDISYYCIDAILPKPFEFKRITPLLSRVLKRISDQKDLDIYLQQLEQFSLDALNTKINVHNLVDKLEHSNKVDKNLVIKELDNIENKTNIAKHKLTDTQTNDIRYTTIDHQMSATILMETLDDTIIDKIEILLEHIDTFIATLYQIEDNDSAISITYIPYLCDTIFESSSILESIGLFNILVRANKSLVEFLESITKEQISDISKKKLLTSMLLGLIQDMENWIKIVFIEQNTDNINYFDASFSNNCMEIVSIFNEQEISIDNDDEDDLEFF